MILNKVMTILDKELIISYFQPVVSLMLDMCYLTYVIEDMRKTKLYSFSLESFTFQEARWTRTRLLVSGLLIGLAIFFSLYAINQYYYNDVFGLGFIQNSALVNENRVLQNQLQYLTQRLDVMQKQLHLLGNKGNELRLLADLPKLDEDLRKAGTGGTDERIDFTSSSNVNTLVE